MVHRLSQQLGKYGLVRNLLMTFTVGSGLSKQACRPPCQLRVSPRAEVMVVGVGGGLFGPWDTRWGIRAQRGVKAGFSRTQ